MLLAGDIRIRQKATYPAQFPSHINKTRDSFVLLNGVLRLDTTTGITSLVKKVSFVDRIWTG